MDRRVASGRASAAAADVGRRGADPRPPDRFLGLEGALADFVAALRTGSVPLGECHDNLRSLAMCHAAVESAALGAPVTVPAR